MAFNIPTLAGLARPRPVGAFSPRGRGVAGPMPPGGTLWLKSDVGTFQTPGGAAASVTGNPVGEWQDQSGNGFHFTRTADTTRPTIQVFTPILREGESPGVLSPSGSTPMVHFDGASQFLERTASQLSSYITNSAFTLYVVGFLNSMPTDNLTNSYDNGAWICDGAAHQWGLHSLSGGETRMFNWDGTDDRASRATTTATFYGLRGRHSGGTLALTRTGLAEGTTASGNTASMTGTLEIGRGNGTRYLGFDLGEVMLFNVDLPSADKTTIENYLANKWGIIW